MWVVIGCCMQQQRISKRKNIKTQKTHKNDKTEQLK